MARFSSAATFNLELDFNQSKVIVEAVQNIRRNNNIRYYKNRIQSNEGKPFDTLDEPSYVDADYNWRNLWDARHEFETANQILAMFGFPEEPEPVAETFEVPEEVEENANS